MSFQKKNVKVGSAAGGKRSDDSKSSLPTGVRPSPLDGRPTTSTGTSSFDNLLAGHAALPLGNSVLVEEAGTTDFSGVLARYYVAEGLVHGHHVHILDDGPSWRKDLPGLVSESQPGLSTPRKPQGEQMKIAWRYEKLAPSSVGARRDAPVSPSPGATAVAPFCHSFDLSKRLADGDIKGKLELTPVKGSGSSTPFSHFLASLDLSLRLCSPTTIHRVVIPNMLSPALYDASLCEPANVLWFLHSLRTLSRQYPAQLSAIISVPITLFPRSTGLVRCMETLVDGVIELTPLAHQDMLTIDQSKEDRQQGLLRCHSLPVFHEKGGGLRGSWSREDMAFRLSKSKGMVITPYHLPPMGVEPDHGANAPKKESLDF